ncbi:hypothetical protein [Mesorhizobium sp. 43Arga]
MHFVALQIVPVRIRKILRSLVPLSQEKESLMSVLDDIATLSKQIDLSATLAKEAVAEFGSSADLAAQVEKLASENVALTAQLQTVTNDLATAQSQVADPRPSKPRTMTHSLQC